MKFLFRVFFNMHYVVHVMDYELQAVELEAERDFSLTLFSFP